MSLIVLLILILLLAALAPAWPYSSGWGYRPSGIVGVLLIIFILLLIFGVVPR
ncbi:DUF3309 domain-containing protein [Legionella jordanis]|uniref:Transmembrane protein n=2 Tax=Legionella jordanis TaxID=456 RepID=A0A0W0V7H3_9GAMM|nr:DUF3309 family protein [Legionella jordanis]KTD16056.1 hypothetical protein Ljor_0362 [Legionella jordanis]RMX04711.1 DUF3309 domain-containing protein [Legionella jordanis]RMX18420.1 DUF3309 domain-containing protein [Legionella jordanis]VEH12485.1 Protein of uncharacterised function (DUF3309) [Legionella jordanis]HAT8713995.1 DUF3309 family protein [Legionella jordanis]